MFHASTVRKLQSLGLNAKDLAVCIAKISPAALPSVEGAKALAAAHLKADLTCKSLYKVARMPDDTVVLLRVGRRGGHRVAVTLLTPKQRCKLEKEF